MSRLYTCNLSLCEVFSDGDAVRIPIENGGSKLLRNFGTFVAYFRKLEFSVMSNSQFEVPLC
jgi:hypothetical protein